MTVEGQPSDYIDAEVADIVEVWEHYRSGFLPEAGSLAEQDARTMEAISFCQRLRSVIEAALHEKAQADAEAKARTRKR
jgi:hypothetical protein